MLLLTKYTVLYKENEICCIILLSLPSRERGLKSLSISYWTNMLFVAPFAGAWIEIENPRRLLANMNKVAPFAGAWIEIALLISDVTAPTVAPFAGAWIEITMYWLCIMGCCVAPFAGAWIDIQER